MKKFYDKIVKDDASGCWNWIGAIHKSGYAHFKFCGKVCYAHRASWEIHNAAVPKGKWVLHTCDNRRCVNPAHLFLGNRADNMRDMAQKLRSPHRRLEPEQVRAIRAMRGVPMQRIADDYGIGLVTVFDIVHRNTWVWLED